MRLHSLLNSIAAVASGQTATVVIPGARRIHALFLFPDVGDDATALNYKIRQIRVKLGGVALIALTIPQLIALNAYRGLAFTTGQGLPLYFSDPTARTPVGEEASALNAFNLSAALVLEIEYKTAAEYNASTSTSSGFTPTLSGLIEYDPVNDGNRAFIKKTPVTIQNSGAGDVDFNTLPREGAYKALHLFTNLVSRARVTREGVEILDRTPAQIAAIGARNSLTPQTNHVPVDFGFTNQATDALEMTVPDGKGGFRPVNDFNFKLTTTGAGNLSGIVEQIVSL